MGDLGQGVIGVRQQVAALLDAPSDQIIDGRHAVFFAEGVDKIVFVHMRQFRQLVQRNIFFKIAVDVPPGLGAFLAGLLGGRDREGKIRVAHQLNDQNLQKILADDFVTCGFLLDLPQHAPQIGQNILASAVEVECAVPPVTVFVRGEFHALNAQHDIFQRAGVQAYLRVLHIGVDDDKVVRRDGNQLFRHFELPHAANHIEKLGAGVGMHQAVPVAPVFGGAHVQQFGDVPVHRADAGGVYLVSFVAHDGFPNFLSCAACRNGQV